MHQNRKPPMTNELPLADEQRLAVVQPNSSPIAILEKAISGGVTQENVTVVKELIQMVREQRAIDAKAAFARALFQLRKNMPEIYIDKEAHDRSGGVAYRYCSEEEISKKLEPHLMAYGFTTLFGQREADGRVSVEMTLMHEEGHQEVREFTVRAGATNAMKDATAADAGAPTTAWRHLMMKMFGLKSHISAQADAHVVGEKISHDQICVIEERIKETGADLARFLKVARVSKIEDIGTEQYDLCLAALGMKRKAAP
jgi:hypothetical protein